VRSPDDNRAQVEKAVEEARARLRWLTIDCSPWTGLDPKNDWKNEFYDAVEFVARILNDDAADSLLQKYAPGPGARDAIISVLRRGCPGPRSVGHPPNSLRDRWIASTVAVVCMDARFAPTRNSATGTRACGCSIVAKALGKLGIKLSEKRVRDIWDKHARAYDRLLRR
jgi:hypothetical protein